MLLLLSKVDRAFLCVSSRCMWEWEGHCAPWHCTMSLSGAPFIAIAALLLFAVLIEGRRIRSVRGSVLGVLHPIFHVPSTSSSHGFGLTHLKPIFHFSHPFALCFVGSLVKIPKLPAALNGGLALQQGKTWTFCTCLSLFLLYASCNFGYGTPKLVQSYNAGHFSHEIS